MRKKGFTLIELLVVIAIIAILAAILFPVFAQARAKARQAACLSNLKQIGTGVMMYSQDYDEILPGNIPQNVAGAPAPTYADGDQVGRGIDPVAGSTTQVGGFWDIRAPRNWITATQPYIKNTGVLKCPETSPRSSNPGGVGANAPYNEVPSPPGANTSYMLNGIVANDPLAVIPAPADIIFIHEYAAFGRTAQVRPHYNNYNTRNVTEYDHVLYDRQHNQGGNFLFCDGHAKWRRKTSVKYVEFGADPNVNCANGVSSRIQAMSDPGPNVQCVAAF